MSKGLEALKRIAYENACIRCQYYVDKQCWNKGECVWKDIEKELEILEIIVEAPFILHELFKKAELGKQAVHRYMWGTISEEEVEKVKEFFKDVEMRNQSK